MSEHSGLADAAFGVPDAATSRNRPRCTSARCPATSPASRRASRATSGTRATWSSTTTPTTARATPRTSPSSSRCSTRASWWRIPPIPPTTSTSGGHHRRQLRDPLLRRLLRAQAGRRVLGVPGGQRGLLRRASRLRRPRLLASQVPALVAIEVKRYPDSRIQCVPRQLHEYLEILDPTQEGLRDDVAHSYRTVCEQLRTLGLSAPDPTQIVACMPVRGLVIVSDYNPRSRLLPRAHERAAKLERPMHLWQPADEEFLIPEPERWVPMGMG